MHSSSRLSLSWLALSLLIACDNAARADGPVLHEQVPNLSDNEVDRALAAAGELNAITYGDEVIAEPAGGTLRDNEAAMSANAADSSGSSDAPGVRSTVYYPDRQTSLEGSLPYFEVFTPSIAPFKRVTALDRVVLGEDGRTPALTSSKGRHTRVSVVGIDAPLPDARVRDRFWGSVMLDFGGADSVPLPSVSPESRVLSLRAEPSVGVRIEKDSADNFIAVRTSRNAPDQVRVVFMTDAPQSYFGTRMPNVRADSLRQEVVALERSIQRRADRFAAELSVASDDPLPKVIDTLTAHFRSFRESSEPPDNTGDIYLDLARGKKGICRHRAYAFVITAQALGIPSRFVQNEAHSWVEVKAPEIGWMRIDLGGAAHGLDAQNTGDQPAYRPAEPDPLPRPAEYEEAYAQVQHRSGPTHDAETLEQAAGQPVERDANTRADDPNERTALGLSKQAPTPQEVDAARGKRGLRIDLDRVANQVYRGNTLQVSGRVTDLSRTPVAGMRIEIALGTPGDDHNLLLGVTVSDAQGYFQGSYGIPISAAVGEHELRVMTPGNDQYLPTTAR